MKISKIRGWLYFIAKILGDVQAMKSKRKNAIPKRIIRRVVGKYASRILWGKLFK